MEEDCDKPFKSAELVEPPGHMLGAILGRIQTIKRRRAIARFVAGASSAVFSIITLLWGLQYLIVDMARSGFFNFSSLVFSDGGAILAYWRDFLFSLVESMPAFGMIIVLTALFAFGLSLSIMAQNTQAIRA